MCETRACADRIGVVAPRVAGRAASADQRLGRRGEARRLAHLERRAGVLARLGELGNKLNLIGIVKVLRLHERGVKLAERQLHLAERRDRVVDAVGRCHAVAGRHEQQLKRAGRGVQTLVHRAEAVGEEERERARLRTQAVRRPRELHRFAPRVRRRWRALDRRLRLGQVERHERVRRRGRGGHIGAVRNAAHSVGAHALARRHRLGRDLERRAVVVARAANVGAGAQARLADAGDTVTDAATNRDRELTASVRTGECGVVVAIRAQHHGDAVADAGVLAALRERERVLDDDRRLGLGARHPLELGEVDDRQQLGDEIARARGRVDFAAVGKVPRRQAVERGVGQTLAAPRGRVEVEQHDARKAGRDRAVGREDRNLDLALGAADPHVAAIAASAGHDTRSRHRDGGRRRARRLAIGAHEVERANTDAQLALAAILARRRARGCAIDVEQAAEFGVDARGDDQQLTAETRLALRVACIETRIGDLIGTRRNDQIGGAVERIVDLREHQHLAAGGESRVDVGGSVKVSRIGPIGAGVGKHRTRLRRNDAAINRPQIGHVDAMVGLADTGDN